MTASWRVGLLLLFIATIARAQTFSSPTIEFDEQFYLLVGDRMLHGAIPYVDIWDRKPIGLFLIFAGIRLFGGDGFLAYQLAATIFVAATGWMIRSLAIRSGAAPRGAIIAATAYILWLNFLQGEGGQASIWYTSAIVAAALLTIKVSETSRFLLPLGCAAMFLAGLAIQIKYTAAVEGALFGMWLLYFAFREGRSVAGLVFIAGLWIALALLPTLVAISAYAAIGHFDDFVFANFLSLANRAAPPLAATVQDLVIGLAIILLPIVAATFGWRKIARNDVTKPFLASWLIAATIAIVAVGTFSPHYFIPLLPILIIPAALTVDHMQRSAIAVLAVAALAGQGLLAFYNWSKGGRAEAAAMVRAIGPVPNCLYVHNGFPSLYLLTNSCLPSRFVFPGHLNTAAEAQALAVNPNDELARILSGRPDAIVTDMPVFSQGNRATQLILEKALAQDYRLVLKLKTGTNRFRMVYRIKS